ncbi:alpha-methylacyl-CoA racemase [Rhopalosiphum padi]|uniref:alpha-methylacyl-CoA racemase n=1 Tax=Rhopalosiphum padi TaxID=40932 RepID=UPI00298D6A62|nr:alpha-methylacyl-CoA racemase [Rhopalosiphum padi]XP_060837313.1 alpha-methylacyl-CoA racemase [Rhopalosiphum padi]XP_060837314.1 alpha-methylacyl-CoA racemase [Rhopalosiphum padi]XP_060837315.1 alpha-methylacyl-CoA racemase [Rhopalosiphum padi]XP_060837316.1 alpha-methylacyl-CoA racemase [Rhopalosiphum padi]
MPLKGLNVLEFSGLAPVPFVGSILSDFGANVTIIQKRNVIMQLTGFLDGGKKSICINLKHPEGVEITQKLITNADILLEPYRPGIMEKLGLGPDVMMAKNPRLIYARLNGYGSQGKYAQRAGHDINYLAISGLLSLYGSKNTKPVPPINFSEFAGGSMVCVMGILMAVIERYKSGKGQVVDANITEGISYVGSWLMCTQDSMIWGKPKGQNLLDGGMHFYDTYETKDGKWMAVGAIEPEFYKVFIEGLGLNIDEIEQMDNFESNREIISKKFKEKTREEWCNIFESKDACVTPVLELDEVDQHPHNASRNSFIRKDNTVLPVPAPKLSATPGVSSSTKPIAVCGQNTREILESMGYNQKEINKLFQNKTIFEDSKSRL